MFLEFWPWGNIKKSEDDIIICAYCPSKNSTQIRWNHLILNKAYEYKVWVCLFLKYFWMLSLVLCKNQASLHLWLLNFLLCMLLKKVSWHDCTWNVCRWFRFFLLTHNILGFFHVIKSSFQRIEFNRLPLNG